MLSPTEQQRYSRHLPIIGVQGQTRLKQSSVLCVGSGGLGCAALPYLVASGVGSIGIIDADSVELSNLQRQVLFTEHDIGKNKAECAAQRLQQLNSHNEIIAYPDQLTHDNSQLIQQYDVIVDGCDNAATRYLLNRHCRRLQKPLVYAAISRYSAQLSLFNYQNGPCYECLYPHHTNNLNDASCAHHGVLGVLPGIVGNLQANETLKLITQQGTLLSGQLLTINLLNLQFKPYTLHKQIGCCVTQCGQPYTPAKHLTVKQITAAQLAQKLTHATPPLLLDVRQPHEHAQGHITNSRLIPLDQLSEHVGQLTTQHTIVCYCQAGKRSLTAAHLLLHHGFSADNIYNLHGGFVAWQDREK